MGRYKYPKKPISVPPNPVKRASLNPKNEMFDFDPFVAGELAEKSSSRSQNAKLPESSSSFAEQQSLGTSLVYSLPMFLVAEVISVGIDVARNVKRIADACDRTQQYQGLYLSTEDALVGLRFISFLHSREEFCDVEFDSN